MQNRVATRCKIDSIISCMVGRDIFHASAAFFLSWVWLISWFVRWATSSYLQLSIGHFCSTADICSWFILRDILQGSCWTTIWRCNRCGQTWISCKLASSTSPFPPTIPSPYLVILQKITSLPSRLLQVTD